MMSYGWTVNSVQRHKAGREIRMPDEESPLQCLGRWTDYHCFRKTPPAADTDIENHVDELENTGDDDDRVMVCKACRNPIALANAAIMVNGSHRHTFFNPSGVLFEIGCFSTAPGCANMGTPTSHFSWFTGFLWRFAACRLCGCHLGWQYLAESQEPSFHGLILDRLLEEEIPHEAS